MLNVIEVLKKKVPIRVSSFMNEWMDCVFMVSPQNVDYARKILGKAFDGWYEKEEAHDVPYGDWLRMAMDDAGIGYEVFYGKCDEDDD